jgi:hypothetical protein
MTAIATKYIGNYPIVAIGPDDPTEGFPALFRRIAPILDATDVGARLVVHGWNHDPRELAEIPEARALLQRFVNAGGLGMLDDDIDKPGTLYVKRSMGAVVVYGIASGQVKGSGLNEIDLGGFVQAYREGCDKFNALAPKGGA